MRDFMPQDRLFIPKITNSIPEIAPDELLKFLGKVTLIDVRRPDEFDGELSHIPGARMFTLGPEFDAFLERQNKGDEIVFVCRSGARSGQATMQGQAEGFEKCVNLQGGMLLWNERKFPVSRKN
jgi:rhodanese-related sulfurtransferase